MATTAPTQTLELSSDFSHGNAWQLMSGTIWTPSPASKLPIPSANNPPETRSFSTFTGFPSLLTIAMAWMSPYVSNVVRT